MYSSYINTCNPGTQEAEAGESWIQCQPGLHGRIMSPKQQQKNEFNFKKKNRKQCHAISPSVSTFDLWFFSVVFSKLAESLSARHTALVSIQTTTSTRRSGTLPSLRWAVEAKGWEAEKMSPVLWNAKDKIFKTNGPSSAILSCNHLAASLRLMRLIICGFALLIFKVRISISSSQDNHCESEERGAMYPEHFKNWKLLFFSFIENRSPP